MDRFTLRLAPDLARRFDQIAAGQGGRSRLLRRLIEAAAAGGGATAPAFPPPRPGDRSGRLDLRLSTADLLRLEQAAAAAGLSRTQWAVALIRRRLWGRPQLSPADAQAFIAVQRALRRIGVNINQIARARNAAAQEPGAGDPDVARLEAVAEEIRLHLSRLRAAFEGNLAYWSDRP